MTNLKIEDTQLVQEYLAMLDIIEEGLEYVVSSYSDITKIESDTVLMDILSAFSSIIKINVIFESVFEKEAAMVNLLHVFLNVTDAAFHLEGNMLDRNMKLKIVKDSVAPVFYAWKQEAQAILGPLVVQ